MDFLKGVFFVFLFQEIPSSRWEIFWYDSVTLPLSVGFLLFSVVVNVKCRRPHERCSQTLGVQSAQLLQKVALHVLYGFCFCGSSFFSVTIIAVCDSTVICAVTKFY